MVTRYQGGNCTTVGLMCFECFECQASVTNNFRHKSQEASKLQQWRDACDAYENWCKETSL
jgi:hypothetical protein